MTLLTSPEKVPLLRRRVGKGGAIGYSSGKFWNRIDIVMQNTPAWILGIAMAILVLLGLIIASRAADPFMYYIGLGFCLFGVLFNYGMISRNSGR